MKWLISRGGVGREEGGGGGGGGTQAKAANYVQGVKSQEAASV